MKSANTSKEAKRRLQYQDNNKNKKKKGPFVFMCCLGSALLLTGGGVGGYFLYNFINKPTPVDHTITWGTYSSSMRAPGLQVPGFMLGSIQTITATSVDGSAVNINCPTDSHYVWNSLTGVLKYTTAFDINTQIKLTATTDNASSDIYITLLANVERIMTASISDNTLKYDGTGRATLTVSEYNFNWEIPTLSGDSHEDFKTLTWTDTSIVNTKTAILEFNTTPPTKTDYTFTLTAILSSAITTVNVPVEQYHSHPVPMNTDFYTFDVNNNITGFASRVIADPTLLSPYNTMDLSYRIVGAYNSDSDSMFAVSVFNTWKPTTINLTSTKFLKNDSNQTGNRIFAGCNLNAVTSLSLAGADFASDLVDSTDGVDTACYTFYNADLSGLQSLSLVGVVFAVANMTLDTDETRTAFATFSKANLSGLHTLSLSGAVFAVENMAAGPVSTASSTFFYADLSGLQSLSLSGAVFAVSGMTTYDNGFKTAFFTFYYADLSGMTSLNLGALSAVGNNTGTNGLNANTFNVIDKNPSWTTTALQISSTNQSGGWGTTDSGPLATWFGADCWEWATSIN